MYTLRIFPKAKQELKKMKRYYQKATIAALEDLQEDPFMGKPLSRELTGRYSYKVGVYRIVYTIKKKDKIVEIITAGHRSTIYQ